MPSTRKYLENKLANALDTIRKLNVFRVQNMIFLRSTCLKLPQASLRMTHYTIKYKRIAANERVIISSNSHKFMHVTSLNFHRYLATEPLVTEIIHDCTNGCEHEH